MSRYSAVGIGTIRYGGIGVFAGLNFMVTLGLIRHGMCRQLFCGVNVDSFGVEGEGLGGTRGLCFCSGMSTGGV